MRAWTLFAAVLAVALAASHAAQAQDEIMAEPMAAEEQPETTSEPIPVTEPATTATEQPVSSVPPPDMPTGRGLIIAGWTVFGLLYLPNLIWGIAAAVYYPPAAYFIVPVFGPIIAGSMALATGGLLEDAGSTGEVSSFVKGMGAFFLIWGLLEGGALAMAIVGHLQRAKYKQAAGMALEDRAAPERKKVGLRVTPWATDEGYGLGVVGWF